MTKPKISERAIYLVQARIVQHAKSIVEKHSTELLEFSCEEFREFVCAYIWRNFAVSSPIIEAQYFIFLTWAILMELREKDLILAFKPHISMHIYHKPPKSLPKDNPPLLKEITSSYGEPENS